MTSFKEAMPASVEGPLSFLLRLLRQPWVLLLLKWAGRRGASQQGECLLIFWAVTGVHFQLSQAVL